MVIRIAAVGDVHLDEDVVGRFRPALDQLAEYADVLLLAGDLTRHGTEAEARCVATEFGGLDVPVVAVLGNHDYHCDQVPAVVTGAGGRRHHRAGGRPAWCCDCGEHRLGIAGVKGFGGGFAGRCASEFGEPEMKAFIRTTSDGRRPARRGAARPGLRRTGGADPLRAGAGHARRRAAGDLPVPRLVPARSRRSTRRRPALAVHGHAHHGTERGTHARRGPGTQRGAPGDQAGVQRVPPRRAVGPSEGFCGIRRRVLIGHGPDSLDSRSRYSSSPASSRCSGGSSSGASSSSSSGCWSARAGSASSIDRLIPSSPQSLPLTRPPELPPSSLLPNSSSLRPAGVVVPGLRPPRWKARRGGPGVTLTGISQSMFANGQMFLFIDRNFRQDPLCGPG